MTLRTRPTLLNKTVLMQLKEEWLRKVHTGEKGILCPMCDRYTQVYRRKINRNMVMKMTNLYRLSKGTKYIHILKFCEANGSGDLSKLKYWELVKPLKSNDGGKHSGMWIITAKGIDFLRGLITVPEHIFTFKNELIRFGGREVNVHDCYNEYFNYKEVVKGL